MTFFNWFFVLLLGLFLWTGLDAVAQQAGRQAAGLDMSAVEVVDVDQLESITIDLDGNVISQRAPGDVRYNAIAGPYVSLPSGDGFRGYSLYGIDGAESNISLQSMRFVGGTNAVGGSVEFDFYNYDPVLDEVGSFVYSYSVSLPSAGNFIWNITLSDDIIPATGYVEMYNGTGGLSQWFLTDVAPVTGTSYGANFGYASQAFELTEGGPSMTTAATNVFPADGANDVVNGDMLEWTWGDNNFEYQVLFGVENPPTNVALDWTLADTEQNGTFEVNSLEPYVDYYWQVNVRNHYATEDGDAWGFTRALNQGFELFTTHLDLGDRPIGAWMQPGVFEIFNHAGSGPVTISALEIDDESGFLQLVHPPLPFVLGEGEMLEVGLTTTDAADDGDMFAGTFAVVYDEDSRALATATFEAVAYTPDPGDVVEVAFDGNTTVFPVVVAEGNFRDNYDLPGATADGWDNVYEFTFANDVNVDVSLTADDAKMAFYAAGFDGMGGPDTDNALVSATTVANGLEVLAGTYYLVVSTTGADYTLDVTATAMPAPDAVTYIAPADGAIDISNGDQLEWSWGANTSEYQVILGTTYPPATIVQDWTAADLDENGSFTLSSLNPNLQYFWQVNVQNTEGITPGAIWGFTTTIDVPAGLEASIVDAGPNSPTVAVELEWTPIPNRAFLGYNVYRDGVQINVDPVADANYTDLGRARNTSYDYNVTALFDEGESDFSNTASVTTLGVGTVNGTVTDLLTGDPIAGASVQFESDDYMYPITTASNGTYSAQVYADLYNVFVTADGYYDATELGVGVAHAATVTTDFQLLEFAYPVDFVTATELSDEQVLVEWGFDARELVEFNIYRQQIYLGEAPELIGSTAQTSFIDFEWDLQDWGVYVWWVEVVYTDNNFSELTASNSLDKDMETMVSVEVALNSGESPMGVLVAFTNISELDDEGEPQYIFSTNLDESGMFSWSDFRKGTYEWEVSFAGYETQAGVIDIFDETELSFLLIEVLDPPFNLYVTPTGLATWLAVEPEERSIQNYKVFLDETLITEVEDTFYQFDVDGLVDGETYLVEVATVYSTGQSPNASFDWTYIACENFDTPTEFVAEQVVGTVDVALSWIKPEVPGDDAIDPFAGLSTIEMLELLSLENAEAGGALVASPQGRTEMGVSRSMLWDNGPLVNSPGTGPGGTDQSILQNASLGMTTLGSAAYFNGFHLADDFVVDANWEIESFTFYGYQTNSPATSSMTAGYLRIYDGDPSNGGNVIWGDMITNRMIATDFTNIYRISETTVNTARPIMEVVCETPGLELEPGTYWVEYTMDGSLASGPWAPPITINGELVTGNGLQYNVGTATWVPFVDGGSLTAQGLPFLIDGTATSSGTVSGSVNVTRIYRDGVIIAEVEGETYLDEDLDIGSYEYCLTYVYPDGAETCLNAVCQTVDVAGGAFVNGTVTMFDGGAPIAGAEVMIFNEDASFTFTTNGAGYYEGEVVDGTYDYLVSADGFTSETLEDVALVYGDVVTQDFVLLEFPYPVSNVVAVDQGNSALIYWNTPGTSGAGGSVFEDFTGGMPDMLVLDEPAASWSVANDMLNLNTPGSNIWRSAYYNMEFDDFVYEVEMQRTAGVETGSMGIYVRGTGFMEPTVGSGENANVFTITQNGSYWYATMQNGDLMGDWTGWLTSSAINTSGPNVISAVAQGTTVQFFVNGTLVHTVNNTPLTGGYVGVFSHEGTGGAMTTVWDYMMIEPGAVVREYNSNHVAVETKGSLEEVYVAHVNSVEPQRLKIHKPATTSSRELVGYNVWRLPCYDDDFTFLGFTLDSTFVDNQFATLPAGVYKWAVEAVYSFNNAEPQFSNCLDVDMITTVTVNVSTNSGDSPEETEVLFVNTSEPDLELMYEVELDDTGTFTWDEFRKGTYDIAVEKDAFAPIYLTDVVIDGPTTFNWILEELLLPVEDLYVTPTGYATWRSGGELPFEPYFQDFNEGLPEDWEIVDGGSTADTWYWTTTYSGSSIDGTPFMFVDSDGAGIGPLLDEMLYSPIINAENAEELHLMFEQYYFHLGAGSYGKVEVFDGNEWVTLLNQTATSGAWGAPNSQMIDITEYINAELQVRFHYFDNTVWAWYWAVDNFAVVENLESLASRELQYYKVWLDNNFIADTENEFYQYDTENLVEGETYLAEVAAVYSNGISARMQYEWTYFGCENFNGPDELIAEVVNNENVVLNWSGDITPPPPPPVGEWLYYDDGINVDGIGGPATFTWAIKFDPAQLADFDGASLTKIQIYNRLASTDELRIYEGTNAATLLHTQSLAGLTIEDWNEVDLTSPVLLDVSKELWIAVNTTDGANFPAGCGAGQNQPNGDLITLDGVLWEHLTDYGLIYTWNLRGYVTTEAGVTAALPMDYPVDNYSNNSGIQLSTSGNPTVVFRNEASEFDPSSNGMVYDNNRDLFDLLYSFPVGVGGGEYSVATDGDFIYTAAWNSANFYKYELDGTYIGPFTIPGAGNLRDLTYDGEFFYGSPNSTTIYKMDFTNGTLEGTITAPSAVRGIAYDEDADGFWVTNGWDGPLRLISRAGAVLQTLNTAAGSFSGLAYDNASDGGPFLWGHNQPASNNILTKIDITTGATLETFDVATVAPVGAGISGGMTITNQLVEDTWTFLGTAQNEVIWVIELAEDGSGGGGGGGGGGFDWGYLGANVYRNGELIAELVQGETYTDEDVLPGDYTYCVTFVYELGAESCFGDPCVDVEVTCESPVDLTGEYAWYYNNGDPEFGALIGWSSATAPIAEWLFYDDGINVDGIGGPATFTWAIKFDPAELADFDGASLTKIQIYNRLSSTDELRIYEGTNAATLLHSQPLAGLAMEAWEEVDLTSPVLLDVTKQLWIAVYTTDGANFPAGCGAGQNQPNGDLITLDGVLWEHLTDYGLIYTWNLRGFVTTAAGATAALPIDKPVDNYNASERSLLSVSGTGSAANNVADLHTGRELDGYNVYRSTDNVAYELIATVEHDPTVASFEYFDTDMDAGSSFYYQVTAIHNFGEVICESYPAFSLNEPENDYVYVFVTSIDDVNAIATRLYPNPANTSITIEAPAMQRITVMNAIGQVVYDTEVSSDRQQLNTSSYEAGVYLVRIATAEGITTKRVTIVR